MSEYYVNFVIFHLLNITKREFSVPNRVWYNASFASLERSDHEVGYDDDDDVEGESSDTNSDWEDHFTAIDGDRPES